MDLYIYVSHCILKALQIVHVTGSGIVVLKQEGENVCVIEHAYRVISNPPTVIFVQTQTSLVGACSYCVEKVTYFTDKQHRH